MIGLAADALVIVLLAAALISVHRLNRRMSELRDGREAFAKLTADLGKQTEAAAAGLTAFRQNAESLGKQLDGGADRGRQVIAEVQRVSDDLRLLIGRAEASTARLEQAIGEARKAEALAATLQERPAPTRDAKGPTIPTPLNRGGDKTSAREAEPQEPAVSPEAAAFLSSLSGMR